jgi:hypothetical protein
VSRAPSPEPGSPSQQRQASSGSSPQRTTSRTLHVKNHSCPPRIATPSHIYIPGAPGPVSNPGTPTTQQGTMGFPMVARAISMKARLKPSQISEDGSPTTTMLLPDGWIAVVCDVGDAWGAEDLPERFYVAPKGVYMPDVTAVGDVVLGKLGYGTVSECVDACTPFVYGMSILTESSYVSRV